ncbi:MAG: hypothetical protein J6V82_03755, partial [Clostridia bacterium]|nr:hypothetical protein [Clostridia bacterium]
IRTPVSGIPTYSRSAGGVIVMRLSGDDFIRNFAKLPKEEEVEELEEYPETPSEIIENAEVEAEMAAPAEAEDAENGEA